ncbi:MAG: hypothetical protein HYR66_16030 [Sphingobacteriales bacterium]|nr:hypothetical protein [Sphingobacteriales bacterium]MBI3717835.1 hypothetical protein [Sphingobacteriales bacterium]
MNKSISPEVMEVMNAISYLPSVSIIMPFEPKTNLKTELTHKLKIAGDKVEQQLFENYDHEKASVVINKLRNLLSILNYDTDKKSVVLYASSVFEKVFYLDIPVEEKIIIDESFEIRDLVYSKKNFYKYLVLILSAEWTKIFLVDAKQFTRVKTNAPDNVNTIWNDAPSKTANFTDPSYRKEVMLDKFLKYADEGLSEVLKTMSYPVFVMGADRTIGHFRKITGNAQHILDYVHGSYEESTEVAIRFALEPYIDAGRKEKQLAFIGQLNSAKNTGKLVTGVENIWSEACKKNCRLLVVEKNFTYAAQKISDEIIVPYSGIGKNGIFIKDAVDDIIEKVLLNGGDVEFVDEGIMGEYKKIALIQYY